MAKTIGTIHGKKTMFLRMGCGEAEDGKNVYELSTNVAGGHPIVRNKTTGQWFTLSWQQILDLAKKAGIDKMPIEEQKP